MRPTRTGSRAQLRLAGVLLLPLLGCQAAIRGDWTLTRAAPSKAAFSIDHASFRPDQTYSATLTISGATQQQTGTYVFTGSQLKLRPAAGGQHVFSAEVQFEELRVKRGDNLVVLRKRTGA